MDTHPPPALFGLASIELRRGENAACHELCRRALAIDAYDSGANYLDGFAFFAEGDVLSARDRLGVAAFDPRYRSAAYALIARSYLREGNMGAADTAAGLSLSANGNCGACPHILTPFPAHLPQSLRGPVPKTHGGLSPHPDPRSLLIYPSPHRGLSPHPEDPDFGRFTNADKNRLLKNRMAEARETPVPQGRNAHFRSKKRKSNVTKS